MKEAVKLEEELLEDILIYNKEKKTKKINFNCNY
jgi:hypothetical protein